MFARLFRPAGVANQIGHAKPKVVQVICDSTNLVLLGSLNFWVSQKFAAKKSRAQQPGSNSAFDKSKMFAR